MECPSQTRTLADGNDLSQVAKDTGYTYLLPEGSYTFSSYTFMGSGTVCYVGQASDRAVVRVTSAISGFPRTMFQLRNSNTKFGMRGLTMVGMT